MDAKIINLRESLRAMGVCLAVIAALWCGLAVADEAAQPQAAVPQAKKTYVEGTDYEIRADKKTDVPQIYEFFSFWCNHCFNMHEQFDVVKRHFAKDGKARFVRLPVSILGGRMGTESQLAYAVATNHNLENEFSRLLFEKIHVKGEIPETHEDYVRMFTQLGIPADRFEQEFNSFPVKAAAAKIDKLTEDLKVDAVPEVYVNGKYYVNMEKLDIVQDLIDVIEYLLTLP